MALVWKTRTTTLAESEEGIGNWEPFAVAMDPESGKPLVICKGLFDVEPVGKNSETEGSLGKDW